MDRASESTVAQLRIDVDRLVGCVPVTNRVASAGLGASGTRATTARNWLQLRSSVTVRARHCAVATRQVVHTGASTDCRRDWAGRDGNCRKVASGVSGKPCHNSVIIKATIRPRTD